MKTENKEKLNKLLAVIKDGTRKRQVNNLLNYLKDHSAYFTAPASPGYHCNWEEGLLEHSMNVAENALILNKALNVNLNEEELVVAGLFHDLGKCYIEEDQPYYLIKEATDKQKQYGFVPDPAFSYNKAGQVFMTVPQRAVRVVTQFVDISDSAYQAILIHDGQYCPENKPYACKESPMALILHYADSWSGFMIESVRHQASDGKSYVIEKPDMVGKHGFSIRNSMSMENVDE